MVPTVACTNCGKNFTTDDLRGTSCRYCGTLLAHHARAAQQVAVVQQMMADRNGNGIPDAYEGLVANAQANAYRQAFGVTPYAPPNPYARAPVFMHGVQDSNIVGREVARTMRRVVLIIVGVVVLLIVLGGALTAALLLR